ncbi:MAG: hypothetical protein ABI663_07430 [Chryseolinea sp.]
MKVHRVGGPNGESQKVDYEKVTLHLEVGDSSGAIILNCLGKDIGSFKEGNKYILAEMVERTYSKVTDFSLSPD